MSNKINKDNTFLYIEVYTNSNLYAYTKTVSTECFIRPLNCN